MIQSEQPDLPQEWEQILEFLRKHRTISFSSRRLSKYFELSSFSISKILRELNQMGYLERRTRGKSRVKSFYRWRE